MYSDKKNINILTAVMKTNGIDTVVACPGSRNAPLNHNFVEAGFTCYSVTDERSAGFYALGLSLALRRPVGVCVTSGSAVLNLAPAVAEAYYRHVPLLIISADRPTDRIGQLEGQTIVQPQVFGPHTPSTFILCEPHDEASYTYCNRTANEAIISAMNGWPVHINVPISQPLYNFDVAKLPYQRIINVIKNDRGCSAEVIGTLALRLTSAQHPMILIGQSPESDILTEAIEKLSEKFVVLYEALSCGHGGLDFDSILPQCRGEKYMPDFVLYAGNTFVSNRIKSFVKKADGCEVWAISQEGQIHDTFDRLTTVVSGKADEILHDISEVAKAPSSSAMAYKKLWDQILKSPAAESEEYGEDTAVKEFEAIIGDAKGATVHYANSMAIRMGNKYARHYCYVNRGTNGIEGTLSSAAGFSLAFKGKTYCTIGDLSFFYDCNALWCNHIGGNLRILLLNNGGGNIFRTIKGSKASPAFDAYISASHNATAEGICKSFNVGYRKAYDSPTLTEGLIWLTTTERERPLLLECIIGHKSEL